jgi:hypothetical protein
MNMVLSSSILKRKILHGIVLVLLLLWFGRGSWASDRIDLSVGIANPSNNAAILENPSALSQYQDRIFDFGALIQSGSAPDFAGSFSSGRGGIGYGFDLRRVTDRWVPTGAFSMSKGKSSIGLSATSTLSPFSPTFDLGVRQELNKVVVALVFRNLSQFGRDWSIGFGASPSNHIRIGLDFDFSGRGSLLAVDKTTVTGTGDFHINQKFSLKLGYGVGLTPDADFKSPGWEAGINFWFSKKNSLYGLYHPEGYNYSIGLKFLY